MALSPCEGTVKQARMGWKDPDTRQCLASVLCSKQGQSHCAVRGGGSQLVSMCQQGREESEKSEGC